MQRASGREGFTLIELLVVVAIIAILAAIALPNFLEAQTRSKIARAKSDIRTLTTALESYCVDNRSYVPCGPGLESRFRRMKPLTTPIAYITSIPLDPFDSIDAGGFGNWRRGLYSYGGTPIDNPKIWALASDGPDRHQDSEMMFNYYGHDPLRFFFPIEGFHTILYDPTNGTVSNGDIFRASDFMPQ